MAGGISWCAPTIGRSSGRSCAITWGRIPPAWTWSFPDTADSDSRRWDSSGERVTASPNPPPRVPGRALRAALPGCLLLAAALCLARGEGGIGVDAVRPPHGPSAARMRLTITGQGFEPGQRAAFFGGGPFVVGSYDLSEGAHGVEATSGHACATFYSHTSKLGGIQILDFSDPAAPIRLGSFETGDSGLDVRMAGSLAIFTFLNPYTFLGGLHIVDVSDPANPRRVGTFDTLLDPRRFVVAGTLVYVAAGIEDLKIIDLEDPAAPRLVGEFDTPGAAADVKLSGHLAYVADDDALLVFDVGDPSHPIMIGSLYGEERSVVGLAIAGPRLVATDARGGLQVIDVSDPARPRSIARVPLADAADGVVVEGRFAYVAAGYSGLQIVDLQRPDAPIVVASQGLFGNSAYFSSVAVSDGRAYVADLINGIQVIDVRESVAPAAVGGLDLSLLPSATGNPAVAVAGSTAYVSDAGAGLFAVDVADPKAPVVRGSLGVPGAAAGLAAGSGASEGLVFLADGGHGVRVIDARRPEAMSDVGGFDAGSDALGIALAGDLALIADGARGLSLFDVREPQSARRLGAIDTPGRAVAVAVSGSLAFVADDQRGLRIIDFSHPESPAAVGSIDTPGRAVGVAVARDRAYVADLNRGVQVIDVSRPESPAIIRNLGTSGAASGVFIGDGRLFVADGFTGLLEYDVADKDQTRLTGVYDPPGIASGITVSGGLAYVADRTGLRIVRPNPPLPPPAFLSPETITLDLPAGFAPGPYDLILTGAAGDPAVLPNGFTVHGATTRVRLP